VTFFGPPSMLESAVVYAGLIVTLAGLALGVRAVRRPDGEGGASRRKRAAAITGAGVATMAVGYLLPAPESRVSMPVTRLDEFAPAWHFREVHSRHIDAPPERVFDAIRKVRADEIRFFQTLTWIRRGGRRLPPGILDPVADQPLLDVAVRGGFLRLADDAPRELVIGTVIARPPGTRGPANPDTFRMRQAPPEGTVLAVMNFEVRPDGTGSIVRTETRVYASGAAARRRFAAYWRTIYPGSALIRRMWLRAIERRARADL
jgi:hypothetical protein